MLIEPRRSHSGIRKDLANALEPLLGKPTESVITWVTLFVRNLTARSKIARLNYRYGPTDSSAALATLKVEVNLNETRPYFPLTTVRVDAPQAEGEPKSVEVVSQGLGRADSVRAVPRTGTGINQLRLAARKVAAQPLTGGRLAR